MSRSQSRLWIIALLLLGGGLIVGFSSIAPPAARAIEHDPQTLDQEAWSIRLTDVFTHDVHLPLVVVADPCAPIPGESYVTLRVVEKEDTPRPAEVHPDKNLAIRGYERTTGDTGLITEGWGGWNSPRPELVNLCASGCTPPFSSLHQVHHWDWENSRRGPVITDPPVTLVGMSTQFSEPIRVPAWDSDTASGYDALVLYATTERITLLYSMFGTCDSVVCGYTIHVEGICVEPSLLALYEQTNAEGREYLPALRGGQAFGRARGSEILLAVRDSPGSFHDPRHKNFWPDN